LLAIWSEWGAREPGDDRIARSLGLFARRIADFSIGGEWAYAALPTPRAKPRRGWRPFVTASGLRPLFNGYFDNRAEIAARCGLPADASNDAVYGAAVERWHDEADFHCIGHYCSAVVHPGKRTVRLARSPYAAPPLYFHHSGARLVAASVPRVLFAAGVPTRLNRTRLVHDLLFHADDDAAGWYHDVDSVLMGHVVVASPDSVRRTRFYDPADFNHPGPPQADAPGRANALLEEAAGKFLADVQSPGILLSGGLDSPLAAVAAVRALPPGKRLASFTFVPPSDWDGVVGVGRMGDEEPLVRELAARYPQIEPHFFANDDIGFDHKSRELMLAMGVAPQGMPNFFMYHALHEAAREAGCDGLINADSGNDTYSTTATWAWRESFNHLRWRDLARNLRAPGIDWRSPLRRFAAYVVMPMLSPGLRAVARRAVKGPQTDYLLAVSAINRELLGSPATLDAQGRRVGGFDELVPRDRSAAVARLGGGYAEVVGDIYQGFEQLYGIRRRDISAYRPLVEYCLSLRGEEFLGGGLDRRLARRMGEGRLPDSIRLNTLYGDHGAGWHARMSRQREALIAELSRYRDNPEMAELIDFDRLIAALEDWPEVTPTDVDTLGPRLVGTSRAVWMARFINFVEGRNNI